MTCNNPGCKACQKTSKYILDGKLTKEEFQNCGYVVDFVDWLVSKNICNTSLNGHMKPLHEWACEFIHPAKGHNWCKDFEIIVEIKNNLVCAMQAGNKQAGDELETLRQCLHILNWGFFYDNNKKASKDLKKKGYENYQDAIDKIHHIQIQNLDLCDNNQQIPFEWSMIPGTDGQKKLVEILIRLASGQTIENTKESLVETLKNMNEDIGSLLSGNVIISKIINNYTPNNNHKNNYTPNRYLAQYYDDDKNKTIYYNPYYMNSAITKIFAFLNCDGFIIYDSRVGASLGELIWIWANEHFENPKEKIPTIMRFYIPGDMTENNRQPIGHIYNVSIKDTYKEHYIANIKASWLVEMIRKRVFGTFYLPCDCEAVDEICCLGDANSGCDCQNSTPASASSYKKCKDVKFHQYIQTRAIESAFFVLGKDIEKLKVC